ncbi:MAG: hypothetical protein V7765_09285 [Oleispira sp.]
MNKYAPEYSKKERINFLLKHTLWVLPLYIVTDFWFFDWLSEFSNNSNCYYFGGITGSHLIFYSLFVGIPLSLFIIILALEGPRSIKIMKLGQNPLPDEKVFKKTKYKYGAKAKIQPIVTVVIAISLLIFAAWGYVQAYEITQDIQPCSNS